MSPVLLSVARAVGWWKSLRVGSGGGLPFIWQLKRGSPFVVSTRIQYVKVMSALRKQMPAVGAHASPLRAGGLPSTIFLLGARDEYISPADCTELGPRAEFAYVELGGSNHTEALQIAGDEPESLLRRERIAAALTEGFEALQAHAWALPAGDIDDYLDPMDLAEGGEKAADTG